MIKQSNCSLIHIAGITLQISAGLPFRKNTFIDKLQSFEVSTPGDDEVRVQYHFALPIVQESSYGRLVYERAPWRIYHSLQGWSYVGFTPDSSNSLYQIVQIDSNLQQIDVYFPDDVFFKRGGLQSVVLIPSDQIILAPILAERQACLIHSAGLIFNGAGLLFVGHSEAGKSTMVKLLRDESEILCDDRIILRRWPDGIKIHGTWSHGEIPDVSPASAPLRALLFLEKALHNALVPMTPGEVARALPQYVIKTLAGREWWIKTLDLVEHVAREVPAYRVQFDKSGAIKELLRQL